VASLQVRVLDGEDLATIERHLLALDPRSRNTRFGSGFAESSVSNYVRRIDLRRAQLVGAIGRADGCLVGLAEAQPSRSPRRVELAVSVHHPGDAKGSAATSSAWR
jgi:hypothetical protein